MVAALLTASALEHCRTALAPFTTDGVQELLGPSGRSALERGDLAGVARALPRGERLATLVRLFLLGEPVDASAAHGAVAPLDPVSAPALFERDGDQVRARVEIRPYAEDGGPPWWVVSDFGSDVRPGPLAPDHVLGIGAASLALARATIWTPVERALDLGTGCGVQALHLSRHAQHVTVTDLSDRALRLASTTAALSDVRWDARPGSLLEPVADQTFDQVVANPPFVVSPGWTGSDDGYDYRDSGLAGDGVSAALVSGIPRLLAPGGTASLLANWIITADQPWEERVGGWLAGTGCDAWVWRREVAEPGEYVALWLRDAGETPGGPRWAERYGAWLDWFSAQGVLAVGMGLVTLWRTDHAAPVVVCEDVRHEVEQPVGAALPGWIARQRWLRDHDDAALRAARLRCADGVVRTRQDLRGPDGWATARTTLRASHGLRWDVEADDAIATLVGACDGVAPLGVIMELLAAMLEADAAQVTDAVLPVVRDLVARGLLEPVVDGVDGGDGGDGVHGVHGPIGTDTHGSRGRR